MSVTEEVIVSTAFTEENGNSVDFIKAESPIEDNTMPEYQDECDVIEDCWGVPKHHMGSFDPDFSRNDIYMFSAGNTLNENLIFQGNLESCPVDASNANRHEKFSYETLENSSPLPPKIVDEVWKIPQEDFRESPDAYHKSDETQPAQLSRPDSPPSLPSSSPPLVPNTDSSNYFKFFTPMQFTPQVKATTRSINFTPFAEKKKDFLKSTLDTDLKLETSTDNYLLTPLSQVEEKTCEFLEGKKEHATTSDIQNEATEEVDETGRDVLIFDIGLIGHPNRLPKSPINFDEDQVEKEKGDMISSQETSQESTENSSSRELGEIFDNNSCALEDINGDSDDDEFADCENNNILVDVSERAPLQPLQIIVDETAGTDFLGSICDDKPFNVAAISPRESGAAESISQNFFDFTNDMLANDYTLIETHAKSGKRRVSKGEEILEKINEEPVAEEAPWALPKDDAATHDGAVGEQPVLFTVDWNCLSEEEEKAKEEEQEEAESGEIDGK